MNVNKVDHLLESDIGDRRANLRIRELMTVARNMLSRVDENNCRRVCIDLIELLKVEVECGISGDG
jgi:hypothetical protein